MGGKGGSQTIGYKYYLGKHLCFCRGPIDKLIRLEVDEREAWVGEATGGQIEVDKPSLFGGKKREGGVSGLIDVEMGGPTQDQNDYLVARLGSQVPAYRGVFALVFRQFYFGNNPYLKPWRARGQRIFVRQDGIEQWYSEKAGIPTGFNLGNESIEGQTVDLRWYQSTKNSGDVDHGRMGISFVDENGVDFGSVNYASLESPYPWTLRTHSVVAPAGAYGVRLWMNLSRNGSLTNNDNLFDDIEADLDGVPMDIQNPGAEEGTSFGQVAQLGNYNMSNAPGWANAGGYIERAAGYGRNGVAAFSGGVSGSVTCKSQVLGIDVPVFDMNPAHIIRECLTDPDCGMGYTDDDIDETSFTAAADRFYSERLGMSLLWDKETILDDFVTTVRKHVDAELFVSRSTGKFILKPIRDDYDIDELITLDESTISSVDNPSKATSGELINSVTVTYWDSETGKDSPVTATDTSLVQQQGSINGQTVSYTGFTNVRTAKIAAERDLRSLSSPLLSCTIVADSTAKVLELGDVFKFSWSKWGVVDMVMRITAIAYGTGRNNKVRISCTEDVFATDTSPQFVVTDPGWVDPSAPPEAVSDQLAFEVPYFELVQYQGQSAVDARLAEAPESGLVGAAAGNATSAINATVYTDSGAGYEEAGPLDFCPAGILAADLDKTTEAFVVDDGTDLEDVVIGSHLQIGNELMRVDTLDTVTGAITVGRGILDTVPEEHSAGDAVHFWDRYAGFDPKEYVEGETVDVKILTASGAGELPIAEANESSVTLARRAFRPYPPGDLRINGESYTPNAFYEGEVDIDWTHRDRLQQTSGIYEDHTAGNIGPEAGTAYRVRGYIDAVLVHTEDDIAGTAAVWTPNAPGLCRVEVHSKRDGFYSLFAPSHEFFNVGFRLTETNQIRYTESGAVRYIEG